jgi:glutamate racemase
VTEPSLSAPIGIFDSGVGGLSVLHHIRRLLPAEDLFYVADNGHLPYGNKHPETVQRRALAISDFLIRRGAKAIVVACNTATAAAIILLRQRYDLPIVGMEPGVKPGIEQSRAGKVAILATEGTLGSAKFQDLMQRHGNGAEVLVQPCPGWVELVETQADAVTVRQTLETQLGPLRARGIDTLVLGCTHYPFLSAAILDLMGGEIRIIDTGLAVARQLNRRLIEANLCRAGGQPGIERFWCSGPPADTQHLISRLWGKPVRIEPLPA